MTRERAMLDELADPTTDGAVASRSDAALVNEVIDGSHEALAVLYDRHGDAVYGAAMRVSRDAWIASDTVQETFLALWNRAELFDPSRGSLPGWLARIARNRTVDHLRAAGRHQPATTFSSFAGAGVDDRSIVEWLTATGTLIGGSAPEPDPEIALSNSESRASVVAAVASLAPLERRVIALAYDAGLSQSEIAYQLGWPIGTVKTRTRRALRHLRDWFERSPAGVQAHDTPADCMETMPAGSWGIGDPDVGQVERRAWGSAVSPSSPTLTAVPCP